MNWLSIDDVCERLNIGRATWYRWLKDPSFKTPERIPNLGKMVRYREDDFQAFQKSHGGPDGGPRQAA